MFKTTVIGLALFAATGATAASVATATTAELNPVNQIAEQTCDPDDWHWGCTEEPANQWN